VEFEDRVLEFHRQGAVVAASMRYPQHHRRLTLPATAGLRHWRREMSGNDIDLYDSIAGPTLRAAGYTTSRGGRSLGGFRAIARSYGHGAWNNVRAARRRILNRRALDQLIRARIGSAHRSHGEVSLRGEAQSRHA
jgi:hypothetical protein